jgi:hypothetical protein
MPTRPVGQDTDYALIEVANAHWIVDTEHAGVTTTTSLSTRPRGSEDFLLATGWVA